MNILHLVLVVGTQTDLAYLTKMVKWKMICAFVRKNIELVWPTQIVKPKEWLRSKVRETATPENRQTDDPLNSKPHHNYEDNRISAICFFILNYLYDYLTLINIHSYFIIPIWLSHCFAHFTAKRLNTCAEVQSQIYVFFVHIWIYHLCNIFSTCQFFFSIDFFFAV